MPNSSLSFQLIFALGVWIYWRQTRARDKVGNYGFWVFIIFLLAAYAGVAFGPAPPSVRKLAIGTLFTWLLVPWAWWFDRHREPAEPRTVVSESAVTTTSAAG